MAILRNTSIDDTGFLQLPAGTTAERSAPQSAQVRYNTTLNKIEVYNSNLTNWVDAAYLNVAATGGNSIYDIDTDGTTYRVHVFTTVGNSTFAVTNGGQVEYLIIAGGGAAAADVAGAGGAGGLLQGTIAVTPQSYTITVGNGGQSTSAVGQNSGAFGLTAIGGGGGGTWSTSPGTSGGSGGGGSGTGAGGAATAGQGNVGGGTTGGFTGGSYGAGGGGGAGSFGGNPRLSNGVMFGGHGGAGITSNITGTSVGYGGGGGGGGGGDTPGVGGAGAASHGGGNGTARWLQISGEPGTPNTGGGGGGTGRFNGVGTGGSGIVVVRYPISQKSLTPALRQIRDVSLRVNFNFSSSNSYPGIGNRVYDSNFDQVTGVLVNDPAVRDFRTHRSSFRFNGSNQHIRLENYQNRPSAEITFESWVFPSRAVTAGTRRGAIWSNTASTYIGIFNSNDGGATHGLHWALQTSNSRSGSNNGSIPNNQWSYIVGTYDGARTRGYINGVMVYDVAQIGSVSDGTYYIGAYNGVNDGTHNWEGNIADAKIYNRALTQQELQNNYNINRWRFGI